MKSTTQIVTQIRNEARPTVIKIYNFRVEFFHSYWIWRPIRIKALYLGYTV